MLSHYVLGNLLQEAVGNEYMCFFFSDFNQVSAQSHLKTLGLWVAQLVKHPTLDFGSGHDLTVCEFEPCVRHCADDVEPAWDCLSLFLSLSLKINKIKTKTTTNK